MVKRVMPATNDYTIYIMFKVDFSRLDQTLVFLVELAKELAQQELSAKEMDST